MAKAGIKDIAFHAGVSIATVSNSLRNPDRVSDATRERVLAAVKQLGYVPNKFGVGLRTSKSHNILVIIPDVSDSFYSAIIKAIEQVAEVGGYSVLLADTQGSPDREAQYAKFAQTGQADGVLLFSHNYPFETDDKGCAYPDATPVVNCCENTNVKGVPLVCIDNVKAAVDATNHLIDYGHTNIAVLTGNMNSPSSQDRLRGFHQAMSAAGINVNEENIIYGEYTPAFGEQSVKHILSLKERPTAVFCFGDEIALGCIYSLRNQGIRVSEEMSVMGFDNVPLVKYMDNPLSTIGQPMHEIGRISAGILLDMLEGKPVRKQRVILKHELVKGISTRPLHTGAVPMVDPGFDS